MKEFLQNTLVYFRDSALVTLTQLFVLLGPLLFLAIVMNFIALKNEQISYKTLGPKVYLYVFGWLGTSIHELGHAIFAIIFAHKISEIKLFTPESNKSLGHVKHNYTKGNPYQTIGNFFIGIGPILLGVLLLWLVTWLLFDLNVIKLAAKHHITINHQLFTSLGLIKNLAIGFYNGIIDICQALIANSGAYWWKIVLFTYLFYSIGSSITLSTSDIKGSFKGFIYFMLLLLIFNLATLWKNDFASQYIVQISAYFSGFYFLIMLSMVLNMVFIAMLFLLGLIISPFKQKNQSKSKK